MTRTYRWSNTEVEHITTAGTAAPWISPFTPVLVASTQSPLGPGSTLRRCEIFVDIGWLRTLAITTPLAGPTALMSMLLKGEVYATGAGGIPNPLDTAAPKGAVTASAAARIFPTAFHQDGTDSGKLTTDVLVTSEAVRGPAQYGGGTPELRLGIVTPGSGATQFVLNGYDCQSTCWMRALWSIG